VTPPLRPLTKDNATGNGVGSVDDLVRLSSSVLGRVDQMVVEMGRRFDDQKADICELSVKLDGVCDTVREIVTARTVEAALAKQTKEVMAGQADQAQKHTLELRWRIGIVISACCGACTMLGMAIALLRIADVGHL
jgi:hypothetical protein